MIGTRTLALLLASAMTLATFVQRADCEPKGDEGTFLNALAGEWTMTGTVGTKLVRYNVQGTWVLQHGWLRLHMEDTAQPRQYEADVFMAYDVKARDYIGHWLDRFGAPGARVVGSGAMSGERLVIIYPYVEGAFRNTFTQHPRGWDLLIESQEKDGTWTTFANYHAKPLE